MDVMVNTRFIGIDGCRFGWVIAVLENDLKLYLVKKISEFTYTEKDSIWVDMPIGLDASKERLCDLELKKAMGKKKSSVFMTPVKDAVYASNYHTASALNFDKTGKKLSIQSWNICNKIAELDSYLFKQTSVFRKKFKESHPEYLFQNVSNISSLTLTHFDTSSVTTMAQMFDGAAALNSLDLSSFRTRDVDDMDSMFEGTSSLLNLDVNGWDISDGPSSTAILNSTNIGLTVFCDPTTLGASDFFGAACN